MHHTRIHLPAWLQMVRAPNLLTVPGDPLAGYLLAGGMALTAPPLYAMGAGVLLYIAGLLLNDVMDTELDRRERPERPIPSGRVRRGTALLAAVAAALAALFLAHHAGPASERIGLALLIAILTYNLGLKRIPFLGDLNMGLCRSLNLLLGAYAMVSWQHSLRIWIAAGMLLLYIASVTHAARRETGTHAIGFWCWMPAAVTLLWLFLAAAWGVNWYAASFVMLATAIAFSAASEMEIPSHRPHVVGLLLSNLLLLQASLAWSADHLLGWTTSIVLVVLWPVLRILSRRVAMS